MHISFELIVHSSPFFGIFRQFYKTFYTNNFIWEATYDSSCNNNVKVEYYKCYSEQNETFQVGNLSMLAGGKISNASKNASFDFNLCVLTLKGTVLKSWNGLEKPSWFVSSVQTKHLKSFCLVSYLNQPRKNIIW